VFLQALGLLLLAGDVAQALLQGGDLAEPLLAAGLDEPLVVVPLDVEQPGTWARSTRSMGQRTQACSC